MIHLIYAGSHVNFVGISIMTFQYAFVYLIVNVVCFLSAIVILTRLNSSIGSEAENRIFRMMLTFYMAFIACEIIWILGIGGFVPMNPRFVGFIKVLGTMFVPIKVYFWLQYAETRFENPRAHTLKFKLLTAIPVIIMVLVYISSFCTGAVAKIGADGSIIPGPAIALTGLIDNIYGIAVVVHAIILMIKDKEGFKRREYVAHILFIVICTIGGITDAVVSDTPVMPLAIMLSFNVLFINLQETKIFNDALTGLNNRRLADRFISGAIEESDENNPLTIFMMDIDNFKNMNDQYGHIVGDKALIAVSEGLKDTVASYHGFLARWGGDEFVVALPNTGEFDNAKFVADLRAEISALRERFSLPFDISLSIGQEVCTDKTRTLSDVINKADEALYKDKARLVA